MREIFGQPALERLVDRLRRRILGGRPLTGWVTLKAPDEAERRAVDRLLSRPRSRGKDLRISLAELEDHLRHAGLTGGLRGAVEAVTGPLENRQARRRRLDAAWAQLLAEAAERDRRPEIRDWLEARRTGTLLRRYAAQDPGRGRELLHRALDVLERLPTDGHVLAELAAETTGDSHALDAGRPLGTLLIDAVARLGVGTGEDVEDWQTAEGRQQIWAAAGVAKDDVSASVLCLDLPVVGDGLCDRLLLACRDAGEPCRLTTGHLIRHPPTFPLGLRRVFVVENPGIVVTARRLGARHAPLISTDGQPAVAVHALLTHLESHGVKLLYHGDFDWPGVRIFSRLQRRYAIAPWRYSARDYLNAPPGIELAGKPAETPWDPDLRPAMERRGRAVHEEQVVDLLLDDLAL